MALVVGIDLGTTGLRSGVFDSEGRLLSFAKCEFPANFSDSCAAEQDAARWWDACLSTLAQLGDRVDAKKIRGLAVVGQNPTLVCVDEHGIPTRHAITWADRRAAAEATELGSKTGQMIDPSSVAPKAMWVQRHDPEAYCHTRWLLQSFDYLILRLTGQPVTVLTIPGFPAWHQGCEVSGLDTSKMPQRTCGIGNMVGELLTAVARKTGLEAGIPVIAGTVDSFAGWIGTGSIQPGIACNDCGTSAGVALCWDRPLSDPSRGIHCVPHPVGQAWIIGSALSCGSNLLDWFVRAFYPQTDLKVMLREAEQVAPGCEGLIALPHLLGERASAQDSWKRAVFFGIGANHRRGHFARAVLEAIAFAVHDVCRGIEALGGHISEVRLAGGGARSTLWNRIKAGVLGKKIVVPEVVESPLLGAAMIAASGVGLFPSLEKAAKGMFHSREEIEPDPADQTAYDRLFELYQELNQNLKPSFAQLARILQPAQTRVHE